MRNRYRLKHGISPEAPLSKRGRPRLKRKSRPARVRGAQIETETQK
jgi:hypothetical protein